MNPAFGILVLLATGGLWLLSRPLWKPFGNWIYDRTDKINNTLKEKDEVANGEKGEDQDE